MEVRYTPNSTHQQNRYDHAEKLNLNLKIGPAKLLSSFSLPSSFPSFNSVASSLRSQRNYYMALSPGLRALKSIVRISTNVLRVSPLSLVVCGMWLVRSWVWSPTGFYAFWSSFLTPQTTIQVTLDSLPGHLYLCISVKEQLDTSSWQHELSPF